MLVPNVLAAAGLLAGICAGAVYGALFGGPLGPLYGMGALAPTGLAAGMLAAEAWKAVKWDV